MVRIRNKFNGQSNNFNLGRRLLMKIRTGFVSNSSSSSFLLYFEKKPTSQRIKRDLLFTERFERVSKDLQELKSIKKNKNEAKKVLIDFFSILISTISVKELDFTYPITSETLDIRKCFKDIWDDVIFYMREIDFDWCRIQYKKKKNPDERDEQEINDYYCKREKLTKLMAEFFLEKYPSGQVCVLEYSDNDGSLEEDLEHSDCLFNLADLCIRVSRH